MIAPSNFFSISAENARKIGVRTGLVCAPSITNEYLARWNANDPWCAPIVIAGRSEIFDFTMGYDAGRELRCLFGIGRYGEDRRGMYETDLFKSAPEPRTIHVGIDIGAAEGTPVFAPLAGEVWGAKYLNAAGDYGGTIILKFSCDDEAGETRRPLFMLFGHLSRISASRWRAGDVVTKGELLGWLGAKAENGGWNPHLHWQLSWLEPEAVDLPGAVGAGNRELAHQIFPDPTPLLKNALAGWDAGF